MPSPKLIFDDLPTPEGETGIRVRLTADFDVPADATIADNEAVTPATAIVFGLQRLWANGDLMQRAYAIGTAILDQLAKDQAALDQAAVADALEGMKDQGMMAGLDGDGSKDL